MKVTNEMLHAELRPGGNVQRLLIYGSLRLIKFVLRHKALTRLYNRFVVRSYENTNEVALCRSEVHIPSSDGQHQIRTLIYRAVDTPADGTDLPVMVYCHFGGYITGSPDRADMLIRPLVEARPCIVVAPSYRTAYVDPYPAGFNDCYDTLLWAFEHAEELGGNPQKIIVAGHSGGGGLTAALTLKARDTGDVNVAFQMPIYPMLDDQQPSDPTRAIKAPVWDSKVNLVAWKAYLRDIHASGEEIPAYAAPARSTDFRNLPPTISFVGTLDPFYSETCRYIEVLRSEGVDVAFETYEGCFHGFEEVFPEAEISLQAKAFCLEQYADFYDRYVGI